MRYSMEQLPIASDALNYEDIISRIKDIYSVSSPQEQQYFINILTELSEKGYSQTLEQLYLVDFKEVPVSIDRFLTDPYYLGETNGNGSQIYPGWWPVYRDVFDTSNDIYEVILSGATRIGKTSTAVSCMAYMTYLLMCYRNPQKYYGLKEVSRATIAFANLTKELAEGVSFREYNDTLLKSPWFCLSGDTEILTDLGYIKLCDAANMNNLHIATMQSDHSIKYVTPKAIVKTKEVTELIAVELEDGTTIKGTPDHPVMLTDGTYKQLGELTENDDVMTLSKETFIPLPKYVGLYEISNLGNIRSCRYNRLLKPRIRKYGYYAFDLQRNGIMYTECLPKLMLQAFVPEYNDQMFYLQDGDISNNALSNIVIGRRYLGDNWRDVPNTDGLLQVSSDGQVYMHTAYRINAARKTIVPEHMLHINLDSDGYACVEISEFPWVHFVHRLVASAFIPNSENKPTVNHINGIHNDNHVSNLEWATYQEQMDHAVRTGLTATNNGRGGRAVKELTTGLIFPSRYAAARHFNVAIGVVKRSIKLNIPSKLGYRFIYI